MPSAHNIHYSWQFDSEFRKEYDKNTAVLCGQCRNDWARETSYGQSIFSEKFLHGDIRIGTPILQELQGYVKSA